ncbi:uncharacterized protein LOC142179618 [Nicotiana tabacum]|uniref:Uncharacterized protein LOC142179618 n=1 Tax=Nicotiana tabacum TaxID=4097 RepID=A0AC58UB37_TOBAC
METIDVSGSFLCGLHLRGTKTISSIFLFFIFSTLYYSPLFYFFLCFNSTAITDLTESSSSSEPPYPYAYHYSDGLLSFIEFSDGSVQAPYAYHYDINTLGPYCVELKDGSILSATVWSPYILLNRSFESVEQIENAFNSNFNCFQFTSSSDVSFGCNNWEDDFHEDGVCFNWDEDFPELGGVSFSWDEDFPELKVGENAENNNVVQVFDESPERASDTSQETKPKSTGKGDKEGVEVSEEQGSFVSSSSSASLCMDRFREELSCAIRVFVWRFVMNPVPLLVDTVSVRSV